MYTRLRRIIAATTAILIWATAISAQPYRVSTLDPATIEQPNITIPDISGYTPASVKKMISQARQKKRGKASKIRIKELAEMRIFTSGEGMLQMGMLQGDLPSALVVEKGVMTLQQVSKAFPALLVKIGSNSYLAKLPIVVTINATLIIEDCTLKLAEESGTFLVNGGQLFLQGGEMLGWREKKGEPSSYTGNKRDFRPFFLGLGGSYTYFSETKVSFLGSFKPKAYGITLSSYNIKPNEPKFKRADFDFHSPPRGWFINSTFSNIYYGFYCHEAEDVVVLNNVYADNIIYGIDPHDRSSRLIIGNNHVYGTKIKHGIIFSREVKDSFIFGNDIHDNKLSGIMLDRKSSTNQVVNNKIYKNGNDGITLYESGDNLIANNTIFTNNGHGIRLRNSEDVSLKDNLVFNNNGFGVYLHTRDLTDHTHRDFKKDPYSKSVSAFMSGGVVAYNSSGSVFVENCLTFGLYDIVFENKNTDTLQFGGDLSEYHNDIVRSLWRDNGVAMLQKRTEL